MKLSCDRWFFVRHNFGRWEIVFEAILQKCDPTDGKVIVDNIGRVIEQKRTCLDCHFTDIRLTKIQL